MNVVLSESARDDLQYWQRTSPSMVTRIESLLEAIKEEPSAGLGKPLPLKGSLTGFFSRRLDMVNRLVYRVENESIKVIQLRYHH